MSLRLPFTWGNCVIIATRVQEIFCLWFSKRLPHLNAMTMKKRILVPKKDFDATMLSILHAKPLPRTKVKTSGSGGTPLLSKQ
jgi:hypothetical protein